MKSIFKTIGVMLSFLLSVMFITVTAKAEGTITLTCDMETAVVGDVATVSFEADYTGDGAEAPQIGISYDPNRLQLESCDKEYGGGGGLLQFSDTQATMSFTVLSGGTAEIDASAMLGDNAEEAATAFLSIAVDGEDTAAALSAATESSTGVEAGTIVSSDGSKIISTVFSDEYLPSFFHKEAGSYQGQPVEVAKFDNGDITLVYVTDAAGENGGFNMLDSSTGQLEDYKMIMGPGEKFIITLKAPAEVAAPEGFTKAVLKWDELELEAYSINAINSEVITDVPATDFFMLYAIDSDGNKGWFLYDQKGQTYQRYLPIVNGNPASEEEEGGFLSVLKGNGSDENGYQAIAFRRLIVIGIMAVVMIVMFIFLLNFFIKLKDYQSYDYVDEDEEDDVRTQPVRREPSVEETSRIRASELARMEMGETFEPVNFDKLVNDPFANKTEAQAPKSVTTPEAAAARLSQAEAASKMNKETKAAEAVPAQPKPAALEKPVEAPKPVEAKPAEVPAKKPVTPGKIASVEDFVKPAEGFRDDYEDEDEDEGGLFSHKKKDKKKNKNMGFEQPGEMDWSSLEGSMKSEDDRRPKGGESPYVKKYGSPDVAPAVPAVPAAPEKLAPVQPKPAAPEKPAVTVKPAAQSVPTPKVETTRVDIPTAVPKIESDKTVKPASQTFKETVPQQESSYWTQSNAGQYQNTQSYDSGYAAQSYDPYAQSQYNQGYGYDPYAQPQYNQGYGYDSYAQPQYNQGYDPYAQPQYNQNYGYNPYAQNPYNTQSFDFDDDFEFEFIDINRQS